MMYDPAKIREELFAAFPQEEIEPAHTKRGHFYRNTKTQKVAASVTTIQSIESKGYLKQWAVNKAVEYIADNIGRMADESFDVLNEAKYAHERELKFAGEVGTTAHDAAEKYIKEWIEFGEQGDSVTEHLADTALPEEIAGARSFELFIKERDILPIASEIRVWYESRSDMYAGTIDLILLYGEIYKDRAGTALLLGTRCMHDWAHQKAKKSWCVTCGRTVKWKLCLFDIKTSNNVNGKNDYAEQTVAYAKAIEARVPWEFDEIWILQLDKKKAKYSLFKVNNIQRAWKRFLATMRHYYAKPDGENLLTPEQEKITFTL